MKSQWVGKILSVLLVAIWMLVIFAYSAKSAEASTKQSMRFGKLLGKIVIFDWNEWSEEKQEAFAARWDHPVRKAGHVAEYAVLGFLLLIAFFAWGFKGWHAFLLALAAGIIYAATDEFHQTFVPGRAGRISDVCIDTCGVLIGAFAFLGIYILIKKCKRKRSTVDLSGYDNFIFDLYGTLIDIRTDEHADETWKKWSEWLDEHGIVHPSPDVMREEFFLEDRQARENAKAEGRVNCPEIDVIPIYRAMFSGYGNDPSLLTPAFLDEAGYAFRTASREYMRLFPGVPEFLNKIRESGRHAYILSNAQRCYTWPEICAFDLQDMVDDVLISSDFGCMKPDIIFFNAMTEKHGLDGSRTVMIGDSRENDYEGGLNAGLHAIWLGPDNPAGEFYKANI